MCRLRQPAGPCQGRPNETLMLDQSEFSGSAENCAGYICLVRCVTESNCAHQTGRDNTRVAERANCARNFRRCRRTNDP